MKDLSAVETAVIEPQVREIQDAIGNDQLTLASETLIDFVSDFVADEAQRRDLQTKAVQIKARVRRLQKSIRKTLPPPEPLDAVQGALLELVGVARKAAELPRAVLQQEQVTQDLVEALDEQESKSNAEGRKSTPEELRKILIQTSNKSRGPDSFALRIKDVQLQYSGGEFKLGPVSLDLSPGQITGIVGMNSSGKTTLLDIACGRLKPTSGTVSYPALEANPVAHRPILSRIGYVKQIPEAWSGQLRNNLNFTAAAFGMTGKQNQHMIDLYVERYGLADHEFKSWSSISGGFKTRFELVRTMVSRPEILVLDEPLAYLDIVTQHIFLHDLRKIAQSQTRPMPILITSQHLYEVEDIADNMVILDDGECIFSGPVSQMRQTATDAVYEVSINAPEKEVLMRLTPHGLHRYEPTALGAILFFDTASAPEQIRRQLVEAFGARLTYFRDISHSTRRLFRNSREDFESTSERERTRS